MAENYKYFVNKFGHAQLIDRKLGILAIDGS